ncbi:hypothetical protein GCM10009665_76710 [Kitasatospora nipponensis]|uniref:Uncharacterized protein n=1 Tax=Kitasatospora nipponensis TaxID=258049 RepID=A0ABP4DS99_9ACTN
MRADGAGSGCEDAGMGTELRRPALRDASEAVGDFGWRLVLGTLQGHVTRPA